MNQGGKPRGVRIDPESKVFAGNEEDWTNFSPKFLVNEQAYKVVNQQLRADDVMWVELKNPTEGGKKVLESFGKRSTGWIKEEYCTGTG